MVYTENESVFVMRMVLMSIVMFFLSTAIILATESEKKNTYSPLLLLLPILYGVFFFFTVDPSTDWGVESLSYFLLHLTGFLASVFFAPYLREIFHGKTEMVEYTNYFSRIAWVFLMSVIVAGSLFAL